ncbi:hypothetical protein DFP72DRAFT_1051668 [Ephemerocybe angulata]|uniref:Uncharacterized protein n=1 Tax=Ephemerocybe angulata TaxID=980116 RepID=A0A8H6LXP1_9AGAR|nr:hypothetical protein DFP72DRAFT_1051668 [Tulosesus angulatus]
MLTWNVQGTGIRPGYTSASETTQVDIWRIGVIHPEGDESRVVGLRAITKLATFNEFRSSSTSFRPFTLKGKHVAYQGKSWFGQGSVAIVDWKKENGKTSAFEVERVYISECEPVLMWLLSNERILLIKEKVHFHGPIELYHWGRDGYRSTDPFIRSVPRGVGSSWQFQSHFWGTETQTVSLGGLAEERLVLRSTLTTLEAFRIPQASTSFPTSSEAPRGEAVLRETLAPEGFPRSTTSPYIGRELCGYHRSIWWDGSDPTEVQARQYSWPDEGVPNRPFKFSKIQLDLSEELHNDFPFAPFFDEISRRLLYLNKSKTRLLVVDLL